MVLAATPFIAFRRYRAGNIPTVLTRAGVGIINMLAT